MIAIVKSRAISRIEGSIGLTVRAGGCPNFIARNANDKSNGVEIKY